MRNASYFIVSNSLQRYKLFFSIQKINSVFFRKIILFVIFLTYINTILIELQNYYFEKKEISFVNQANSSPLKNTNLIQLYIQRAVDFFTWNYIQGLTPALIIGP